MAHIGNSVEYALHCLLWLAEPSPAPALVSSRDLADLQGLPAPFLAKIFPKLEKAGIVAAGEGIRGGYRLARPAEEISVLDVVDAIDDAKPLFDCQEVRERCSLFGEKPPRWATAGTCGIHAVMLRAEKAMRDELARTTLASLATGVAQKAPAGFRREVVAWLEQRVEARDEARLEGLRRRRQA